MASLATMYNRILGARTARVDVVDAGARAQDSPYLLRSIPNEDIYFFTKEFNNSRVVRQADPQARGVCWKLIASGGMAVLLLAGILAPSAYGLLAGYQIQSLKQEQQRLLNDKATLELEEARLLSPQRLEELARIQSFVDPAPQSVVYLDSKDPSKSEALALNKE